MNICNFLCLLQILSVFPNDTYTGSSKKKITVGTVFINTQDFG